MTDSTRYPTLALAAACLLAQPARSAVIELDFNTLPSTQGFVYTGPGGHADETEAEVFTVNGTTLDVNTIGDGPTSLIGSSATYTRAGVVTTQSLTLDVRLRILESQFLSQSSPLGHTLFFAVRPGAEYYFMALNANFAVDGDLIRRSWDVGFDVSEYHDYRWVVNPGGAGDYDFFVDGNLFMSGTHATTVAHASGSLLFGDGTGGSNIHADINYFRFTQGEAAPPFPQPDSVPEPGTLALLGLGLAGLAFRARRRAR